MQRVSIQQIWKSEVECSKWRLNSRTAQSSYPDSIPQISSQTWFQSLWNRGCNWWCSKRSQGWGWGVGCVLLKEMGILSDYPRSSEYHFGSRLPGDSHDFWVRARHWYISCSEAPKFKPCWSRFDFSGSYDGVAIVSTWICRCSPW
jgi:hypothetical protein